MRELRSRGYVTCRSHTHTHSSKVAWTTFESRSFAPRASLSQWWECSVLSQMGAPGHMWLLVTWSVAGSTKELKVSFFSLLIHWNLNCHLCWLRLFLWGLWGASCPPTICLQGWVMGLASSQASWVQTPAPRSLAGWPWASYLIALNLSFFPMYKPWRTHKPSL